MVLSQTSLRQAYREYVVKKLIEGGAKRENIQVLELRIDPDVKLTGLYYRTKDHIEYAGKTITDEFKRKGWDGEGPFTVDEYKIQGPWSPPTQPIWYFSPLPCRVLLHGR